MMYIVSLLLAVFAMTIDLLPLPTQQELIQPVPQTVVKDLLDTYPPDTVNNLIAELVAVDFQDQLLVMNYSDVAFTPRVENTSYVWDFVSKKLLYQTAGYTIEFLSPGKSYFVAYNTNTMTFFLLDKRTGVELQQFRASNLWVSPDDSLIVYIDHKGLSVWSVKDKTTLQTLSYEFADAVGFCPDSSCIVVAPPEEQGSIYISYLSDNFETQREIQYRDSGFDYITGGTIPFSPDGSSLVVIETLDTYILEVSSGKTTNTFPTAFRAYPYPIPAILPVLPYVNSDESIGLFNLIDNNVDGILNVSIIAFNSEQTKMIVRTEETGASLYYISSVVDPLNQVWFFETSSRSTITLFELFLDETLVIAHGETQGLVLFLEVSQE